MIVNNNHIENPKHINYYLLNNNNASGVVNVKCPYKRNSKINLQSSKFAKIPPKTSKTDFSATKEVTVISKNPVYNTYVSLLNQIVMKMMMVPYFRLCQLFHTCANHQHS